jgi:hypothetical protein
MAAAYRDDTDGLDEKQPDEKEDGDSQEADEEDHGA